MVNLGRAKRRCEFVKQRDLELQELVFTVHAREVLRLHEPPGPPSSVRAVIVQQAANAHVSHDTLKHRLELRSTRFPSGLTQLDDVVRHRVKIRRRQEYDVLDFTFGQAVTLDATRVQPRDNITVLGTLADLASGKFAHHAVVLFLGVLDRRRHFRDERHVDMHASVVDRLVKHPYLALTIRQVWNGFIHETFHLDVAPAVHHVAVQVVGVVPPSNRAVGVEPTRLGHFHHNLAALKVFAERQPQSVAQLVQRLRVRDGRGARHGAVALIQLEFRPVRELPTHDDIPHCTLKAQIVRLEYAAVSYVVQQRDRIGVAVTPFVNRVVAVELVPETPRVRGRVRAVLMHASLFQVSRRPAFKIQMHGIVHG